MLKLFNSLTRKIEEFSAIGGSAKAFSEGGKPTIVGFYICGPTVYDNAHIGNLRTMLLGDLIRRVLEFNGYKVKQVMNITDVGHLTSDSDSGEDKMEKNAKTEQDVLAIAEKYAKNFLNDLKQLNILSPSIMPKASEHVAEQIEMIKSLIDKGFAYESEEAVYFNISKFPEYTKLVGQSLDEMMLGARQEVVKDKAKKNPYDFVLWFKTIGRYENHILRWASPWGQGFPGWHIECSAMSKKYLGETFDIHIAGIDLKFPHNTNEIAQSESANGKSFANYWIHGEHLLINDGRMAKSEGTGLILQDIIKKRFNPLAFRYLVLTSHYRSKLNFTFESLQAAQNALNNLYEELSSFDEPKIGCAQFEQDFLEAINNDLDTPKALAIVWNLIRTTEFPTSAKAQTLFKFDRVLGLKFEEMWKKSKKVPKEVQKLIEEREKARKGKDFAESDELRQKILDKGFVVEDTIDGYRLKKKY